MNNAKYEKLIASIENAIWTLFRKYDMSYGEANEQRMKSVLNYCKSDLQAHPDLIDTLNETDKIQINAFVNQSILYMI